MDKIICCICNQELKSTDARYIYLEYDNKETPSYAHLLCHKKKYMK